MSCLHLDSGLNSAIGSDAEMTRDEYSASRDCRSGLAGIAGLRHRATICSAAGDPGHPSRETSSARTTHLLGHVMVQRQERIGRSYRNSSRITTSDRPGLMPPERGKGCRSCGAGQPGLGPEHLPMER